MICFIACIIIIIHDYAILFTAGHLFDGGSPFGRYISGATLDSLSTLDSMYARLLLITRLPCFILTKLLHLRTTRVYPSLPLQTLPLYTPGVPLSTPCNIPSTYWACLSMYRIDPHGSIQTVPSIQEQVPHTQPPPECIRCQSPLAIKHILLNCVDFYGPAATILYCKQHACDL